MITSLVKSLDYKRELNQFSSLDSLVSDKVIQEHKMNDRDFMQIAKKGQESLSQYIKVLKLKSELNPDTKLLVEEVVKREGYNSKIITKLLSIKVKRLSNPFDFNSFEKDGYRYYIPQNTLDMFCATVLLVNCTYYSSHRTKRGQQERIFIINEGRLSGIFTVYKDLKKPAWALTRRYSQSWYASKAETELKNLNLVSEDMIRLNSASEYLSLIKFSSWRLMCELMTVSPKLVIMGIE